MKHICDLKPGETQHKKYYSERLKEIRFQFEYHSKSGGFFSGNGITLKEAKRKAAESEFRRRMAG